MALPGCRAPVKSARADTWYISSASTACELLFSARSGSNPNLPCDLALRTSLRHTECTVLQGSGRGRRFLVCSPHTQRSASPRQGNTGRCCTGCTPSWRRSQHPTSQRYLNHATQPTTLAFRAMACEGDRRVQAIRQGRTLLCASLVCCARSCRIAVVVELAFTIHTLNATARSIFPDLAGVAGCARADIQVGLPCWTPLTLSRCLSFATRSLASKEVARHAGFGRYRG